MFRPRHRVRGHARPDVLASRADNHEIADLLEGRLFFWCEPDLGMMLAGSTDDGDLRATCSCERP